MPAPAAERMIVDGAVFIARKAADVHRFQPPEAGIEAAAGERGAERARKDLGVEGEHPRAPGRGARRPVIARGWRSRAVLRRNDDDHAAGLDIDGGHMLPREGEEGGGAVRRLNLDDRPGAVIGVSR